MVVEYIRYAVPSGHGGELRGVLPERRPRPGGSALPGLRGGAGVEEPAHFVMRIEWDSVERQEQGFRASSRLGEFFSAVRPFYAGIDEMKHYAVQDRGQPG